LGSQYARVTPLDGEQTFILAIGEQEIEISVDGDGPPIKLPNLEHQGEIKPEDYLSIRLYLSEDSQNVLWDWAFKIDGINLITSDDQGSREKKSFIMCETAQANANTCELQTSIRAQLVGSLDDNDIIVWKVEALKGNMATDDLDSSSNATNKPYMYGKTKAHKTSAYLKSNWSNTAGINANLGKYSEPYQTSNLIYKNAKYFSFQPDMSGEAHMSVIYDTPHCAGQYVNCLQGTNKINIWRHNPHVAYKITAIVNGTKEYTAIAKMDHTDVLRQEYINHITSTINHSGGNAMNAPKSVVVPDRDAFKAIPTTGNWVERDKGEFWNYSYDVLLDVSMQRLLGELTTIIDNNITTQFTTDTDEEVQWPSAATIEVTSGYRNPERNERVGGATGSRHMMGRALDLAIKGVEGADKEIAYYVLWEILKANQPASADMVQMEDDPADWTKRYSYGNSTESTDTDWINQQQQFNDTGIEDGFLDVEHIHLQDNP
jgi:hypothetical protein